MFWSQHSSSSKLCLIVLVLSLCFPVVFAQSISFAEPDTITHKDMYMYYANGTLIGLYNTTSTGISLPSASVGDIQFTFKPKSANPLDDPAGFLANFFSWLSANALQLLILGGIGGLLFRKF
jgi:hypothetical protein